MTSNYEPSFDTPRPWFLNPAFVFYATWLIVYFLYTLHLSNLLIYPNSTLFSLELPLLGAFLPMFLVTKFLPNRLYLREPHATGEHALEILDRRLRFWFSVWIALTIVEVIYSGGIPILWNISQSSKTYFDFGIPTLHGLLNGLVLAISITRFATGIKFHRKLDFLLPIFTILWSLLVVTRQGVIIIVVEASVIFLLYRKLKLRRFLLLLATAVLSIVVFGISGDIRSGGTEFRVLAQPTDRYPSWLPSGFLWAYMYTTTPLNNLVNTWVNSPPSFDIKLPNTTINLIPTALHKLLGDNLDTNASSGDLVTQAFNVSTAYVGPFKDMGVYGIEGFSCFIGLLTGIYWRRSGTRDNLIFAVLTECLVLTIFYDHFLYLPVISQAAWIYLFFRHISVHVAAEERGILPQTEQPA